MKKAWLGVFAALTMFGSTACSSSSDPGGGGTKTDTGGTGTDGGGGTDTKPPGEGGTTDTGVHKDVAPVDGAGGDGGKTGQGTTGKECVDDTTCDVSGDGIQFCSNAGFSGGTLYPSPVCLGLGECDPGDGTTIMYCDGEPDNPLGVCLSSGGKGLCLPLCTFADDGATAKGCAGKDACNAYGWGKDTSGVVGGVGYCFGGCTADADCTKGDKCQDGLCLKAVSTKTKAVGDPCTDADAKAPEKCDCVYATASKKGYCTQYCQIGNTATACPTGFTCSAGLPTTDSKDGSALFSKEPAGMAGNCLKPCTADADCSALGTTCVTTPEGKVCWFAGG